MPVLLHLIYKLQTARILIRLKIVFLHSTKLKDKRVVWSCPNSIWIPNFLCLSVLWCSEIFNRFDFVIKFYYILDGLKTPISYASRVISNTEKNYSRSKRNCTAKLDLYILFWIMNVLLLSNEKKLYSVLRPQTVIINILREKVNSWNDDCYKMIVKQGN